MREKQKKMNKEINLKGKKGITLIALVITIVVLLILAGVTIATLTGDNGLLQKATDAKQANEEASALEKIQVEVAGSYGLDGRIDIEQLNYNFKRINGLKYKGNTLGDANKIDELPIILELEGYQYEVEENGTVSALKPQAIGNLTKRNYGDYLDLGLSIIGTNSTSDDWRILYNDKNNVYGGADGARVYAILADYLPSNNQAVTASELNVVSGKTYNVNSTTGDDLIGKLNNTTAWQSLIPDGLRSTCQVKGATTGELLIASYNEKYGMNFNYIDRPYLRINPSDSSSSIDTLYMPHPGDTNCDECYGYWLASPYDHIATNKVWFVSYNGDFYYYVASNANRGVCPVVSLPSNLKITKSENVWTVVQ